MTKTFSFGKHAVCSNRKENLITVEVNYKDGVFSASADVWNRLHTDIVMGGQCLDELVPYLKNNETYMKIYRLWKAYHLNDMNNETPEQKAALETPDFKAFKGDNDHYNAACVYLKGLNLYTVPASQADPYRRHESKKGTPYTYGHEWLFFPIPTQGEREIFSLFY